MTALELVAFDIETTGFTVDDSVTVVGFALPMGCRVFCQTDGRDVSGLESRVGGRVGEHVVVSTHESEAGLLGAVGKFAGERLAGAEVLVVAYNGERWKAGFDLPFLRTRLAATGVDWPFVDVPYADLLPVIRHRFNTTTEDGDSVGDLVGAYELLGDDEYAGLDPFADSEAAVAAFEAGEFEELVVHNVADVLRTRALGRLAQTYCSKSDFSLKSLTPASHA